MAELACRGASVEGEKLELKTRKFGALPPKRASDGRVRWGFKLGIVSSAAISEAYLEPKTTVEFTTSLVALGDVVKAAVISGWSKKPLGPPHVGPGSGAHSATFLNVAGGCFAGIDIPAREHLESLSFEKANPAIARVRRDVAAA